VELLKNTHKINQNLTNFKTFTTLSDKQHYKEFWIVFEVMDKALTDGETLEKGS